jgi:hypothetical protein
MTLADIGIVVAIVLGIFGAVFGAFNYFKKPQEDMDKKQAIAERDMESKAHILAEQLNWEKEANERRFTEMTAALNQANCTAMNHIHTIDVKLESIQKSINENNVNVAGELVRLSTIINERIPKREV